MQRVVKLLGALLVITPVAAFSVIEATPSAPTQKVDFAREIEPIFKANCYHCHGAQKAMAQLRLDRKQSAAKVITPGNGKESRLLQRVLGLNGEKRMPLGGEALKPEQASLIQRWIDEGAEWPESNSQLATNKSQLPKHWAFSAPRRPALPEVKDKSWIRTPIDNFILAGIEAAGLRP